MIGVILTATSVSITVETLKELGKLKTRSGNAILGAAIIDDILGIVALTNRDKHFRSKRENWNGHAEDCWVLCICSSCRIHLLQLYKNWVDKANKEKHRHTIVAFVFCLLMAYIAEDIFSEWQILRVRLLPV